MSTLLLSVILLPPAQLGNEYYLHTHQVNFGNRTYLIQLLIPYTTKYIKNKSLDGYVLQYNEDNKCLYLSKRVQKYFPYEVLSKDAYYKVGIYKYVVPNDNNH